MNVDEAIASALGFAKLDYTVVERERRWLCHDVPRERVRQTELITDLYVTGTRLRLREARPINGETPLLRLSRKADVDRHTRLVTSIYLPAEEFALLANVLSGTKINKIRHRLQPLPGVEMLVDEFQGTLSGLILAEAAFETAKLLAAFAAPDFVAREVTNDPRYTGGELARLGVPPAVESSL